MTSLVAMDYALEQWINGPAGSRPLWDAIMSGVASSGEAVFVGIIVVWFLIGWLRDGAVERQAAITGLAAAGLALLVNVIVSHVWFRIRPFVAHPNTVHLLLSHSKDASFPSDHASAAFAITLVLLTAHRKMGAAALAFAVVMSYARVYVGDHYPGDVLTGAVIGLLAAGVFITWLGPLTAGVRALVDRIIVGLHLPLSAGAGGA